MRIVYEYGHRNAFPRYFAAAGYEYCDTLDEAYRLIRRVCGKTRRADLIDITDPFILERRRNAKYIVTILDDGAR